MTAPLYKNNQAPNNNEVTGNKGLWFDRFYDQYDEATWEVLKPKNNDEKKGNSWWLTQYFHNKKVGNDTQLSHHSLQQKKLAEDLQGNSLIFSADWHMVTGMGNPHPVENGFAWHPTLGVPYLTGAAVKGLVRTYIENYLDADNKEKQALLLNWFGSTDKNPHSDNYITQTGNLIFFDALPVEPVELVVDIMTPHMGGWYQDGADNPDTPETVPADWHDPIPVTFLSTKEITLQFSFALRQYPENTSEDAKQHEAIDLEDVKLVLTNALKYLGAGGKTATGYGAMNLDTKRQEDQAELLQEQEDKQNKQNELESAKKNMTPLAAEFFEQSQINSWETDKNAFWKEGIIERWLEQLEEDNDPELKQAIVKLFEMHFQGAMENPDKTRGKKNKPVYKPRVITVAKRLLAID